MPGEGPTRMTKTLQLPKRSPLTKNISSLPLSPRGKKGVSSSPIFSPLKDQRSSSTHGATTTLANNSGGNNTQLTTSYDKWSSLLNLSEEDLNRRYEEWMRIAADNVSEVIIIVLFPFMDVMGP